MPEQWTADLLGKMHMAGITAKQLSEEAGMNPKYVSTIINGHVNPKNAEKVLNAAFQRIVEAKEKRQDTA